MNNDTKQVHDLAQKILYTPSMTALDLIDELREMSEKEIVDSTFGIKVRSVIYQVHTNLKH